MNPVRIVILGAGYAGVRIARRLQKQSRENIQLVLIDQNTSHTLVTNLHEAASGRVSPETLQIPLDQIFKDGSIELIADRITAMDLQDKILTGEKGIYTYDQLIIASGSGANYYGIPGAREHSIPLDSMEGARRIRERVMAPETKEVLLCGGGLTGVEMAADLKIMHPHLCVTLIEAKDRILPELEAVLSRRAAQKLKKIGVELLTGVRVEEVNPEAVRLAGPDGVRTQRADLILWTSGTQARWGETVDQPAVLSSDARLCLTAHRDVFMAGDAGDPEWACVENGLQSADCLAENLERLERGEELRAFELKDKGQMIAMGPFDGITTTRIPLSGWPAMVLKFLVDLFYVFSVGGIGAAVNYFNGHLVVPFHGKTLTGTLLSTRGQRLWLFPLRLYLGSLWFLEGWKKVIGPSQFERAAGIRDYLTRGSDSWLSQGNLMMPFPWLADVDAISSATMGGTSGPIVEGLPVWYEAIMRTIMPNPSLGMFFQSLLVWAEVAVGAGLILGLLTWLASLVSIGLIANFIVSGVAGWQLIWILPASAALMAGAGRFLGLDAWLMPRIRRRLGIRPL